MAGVVRLLVERRLTSPGSVVAASVLIEAGWPDEKLPPRVASNRLRVLVSNLRASGLKDILLSAEGGYFLEPHLVVVAD